jgi:hypothetical protein
VQQAPQGHALRAVRQVRLHHPWWRHGSRQKKQRG